MQEISVNKKKKKSKRYKVSGNFKEKKTGIDSFWLGVWGGDVAETYHKDRNIYNIGLA